MTSGSVLGRSLSAVVRRHFSLAVISVVAPARVPLSAPVPLPSGPSLQWSSALAQGKLPLAEGLTALFLRGVEVLLGVMARALAELPWCHPASKRLVPVVTSPAFLV